MKVKANKVSLILIFVFLLSIFVVNTQTQAINNVNKNSTTKMSSLVGTYTNVSSISITSNSAFASAATTYSWSGTGTLANPYVIQGMRFNSTTSTQLDIETVTANFTVQNNIFENGFTNDLNFNVYIWQASDSGIIKSNTFQNTNQAIKVIGNAGNITLSNNVLYSDGSTSSIGLYDHGSNSNLNISNNSINDFFTGMKIQSSNVVIINNTIQNTLQGGTDILNSYGLNGNYTGNIFTGSYATGITLPGTSENYFHQIISTTNLINGKPMFYLRGATSGTVPANSSKVYLVDCVGVTVSGLSPTNSVDYSVYLINTSNSIIQGNTLTSSLDTVTGINSNNVTVSGNTLTSTNGKALNLQTVNNTITNNHFYGQVSLKTGDTNLQTAVTGNTVNGETMVYMLSQSSQTIQNAGWVYILKSSNIQINNSMLGYLSIANSSNIQITNAYTTNIGFTAGIDYSKDLIFKNVTFINGAIEFDFNYDLNVQVIGSTFSQMLITNNNYAVLSFQYSNNTVIRDNTFNSVLNDYAIYLDNGVNNITLQNNRFNKMYSDAVYMFSSNPSTVSITYNTFNIADNGLTLYIANATIQFNIFENNYYYGLDVESANNTISFNTFRENTGFALNVNDVNETITNNVFVNNFDGIAFSSHSSTANSIIKNNYFTNSGNYLTYNYYQYYYSPAEDSAIQVFSTTGLVITGNIFNYDVNSLYIDSGASNITITKNSFLGRVASFDGVNNQGSNTKFTANYYDDYTTGSYYIGATYDYTPLISNPFTSFNISASSSEQYALNATTKTYSFTYIGPWSSYVEVSVDNQAIYNGIVNSGQTVSLSFDNLGVGNHMVQIVGPTTVTASVFVYDPNNYLVTRTNTTTATVTNTAVSTVKQNGSNSSSTSTSSSAKASPGFTILSILTLLVVVPVIAYRKRRN